MKETSNLTLDGIDFIDARSRLVEYFGSKDQQLAKDPYVQQQMQGLEEIATFTSRQEFESRIESLYLKHHQMLKQEREQGGNRKIRYVVKSGLIAEKLSTIEKVYECLRFFWEENGPFDPESLTILQAAIGKPVWSDDWKFKWGVKPPISIDPNHPQREIYKRIDIGSQIQVTKSRSSNLGTSGKVIAFWNPPMIMFGLFAVYKTPENWVFANPISDLDLTSKIS